MNLIKKHMSLISFSIQDYLELRPSIRNNNFKSLRSLTLITSILFAALVVFGFLTHNDVAARNRYVYVGNFVFSILLYALSPVIVKKIPSAVAVMVYLFMIQVHFFGIMVGGLTQNSHPATSYIVMMFVIPIMFIDRPWRVALFNFVSISAFLTISCLLKEKNIFITDVANSVCFYFLSIICGRYFTQVKINQLKLIKIAETQRDTDSLTGVLTKSAFLREMDRLLTIDSSSGIFLMIDVDNFKQFNDTYGHAFGDKVLQVLGRSMNNSFRRSDLLGRFGGDEFFVFIPSTNDTDVALYRAKSLQMHMATDIQLPDSDKHVTISIGIANCKGLGETYQTLFKRADEAIYEAKAAGKDSIAVK